MHTLARDSDLIAPIVFGVMVVLGLGAYAAFQMREWIAPRRLGNRLNRFFGRSRAALQAHDKQFPGYDLASVSRALAEFLETDCVTHEQVGCVHINSLQDLLTVQKTDHTFNIKPSSPTYQRLPVDVDVEESFVSNCLYFAELRPAPGEQTAA